MIITRQFHTDPGHGWLEVYREDLKTYEVTHLITSYSYQKNGKVYLEEDCDLTTFFKAVEQKGDKLEIIENSPLNSEHWIRAFDHYSAI